MPNEDQKQAVSIVTTLSGQLMAAALGMIALEGAFLTFAMDKKVCGFIFWCAVVTAFLSFVVSIIRGGKGITRLYKDGASGNWDYAKGDTHFQWQTGLCCLGLMLFLVAVVSAWEGKPSDAEAIKNEITKVVGSLDKQTLVMQQLAVQAQSNEINRVSAQVGDLKRQVQELSDVVERMKRASPPSITNLVMIGGITNVIQIGPATNFIQLAGMTNTIVMPPAIAPQPPMKPTSIRRWGIGIGAERRN